MPAPPPSDERRVEPAESEPPPVVALPLSRAALDRCVGTHLNGTTFSHVARAVRLVPGTSVRKWLRRG